jgi:uncharacterized membrane protein
MIMRILLLSAIALPTFLIAAPAGAITRDQAVAQCRAIHANPEGVKRADRTGVSVPQQVKQCVQAKMRANKGK